MSIRERVLENIRNEVRKYLRDGTAMPARDVRWQLEIDLVMKEETKIFQDEQQAEIEAMYANYHKKHVSGCTFEEWLETSKKLYKVNGCTVTSIALGPENEREFGPFKSEKQAHKKLLQLIYYKQYDHYVRGHDFAYNPDEQI